MCTLQQHNIFCISLIKLPTSCKTHSAIIRSITFLNKYIKYIGFDQDRQLISSSFKESIHSSSTDALATSLHICVSLQSCSVKLLELWELRGTQAHLWTVSLLWWKITDGQSELSERQHSSSEKNVSRFPPHRIISKQPMRRRTGPGAKLSVCWSRAVAVSKGRPGPANRTPSATTQATVQCTHTLTHAEKQISSQKCSSASVWTCFSQSLLLKKRGCYTVVNRVCASVFEVCCNHQF